MGKSTNPVLLDNNEITKIKELISPMFGKPAWRIFSNIDGLFDIQIGDLKIENTSINSEWGIYFDFLPWKVLYKEKELFNSLDDRARVLQLMRAIEGHTILDIEISPIEHRSKLIFDDGLLIIIHHKKEPDPEHSSSEFWSVYKEGKMFISIMPGNYWNIEWDKQKP